MAFLLTALVWTAILVIAVAEDSEDIGSASLPGCPISCTCDQINRTHSLYVECNNTDLTKFADELLKLVYKLTNQNLKTHNLSRDLVLCPPSNGIQIDLKLNNLSCSVTQNCPTPCKCVLQPYDKILLVNCKDKNLDTIPERVPNIPHDHHYDLVLTNNSIRVLPWKDYLLVCHRLDVSYNKLTHMSDGLKLIQNLKALVLYDNPWQCDCDAKWMTGWLASLGEQVINKPDDIRCHSPKHLSGERLMYLRDEEFCGSLAAYVTAGVISGVVIASVILIITLCCYRRRTYNKLRHYLCHNNNRDNEYTLDTRYSNIKDTGGYATF